MIIEEFIEQALLAVGAGVKATILKAKDQQVGFVSPHYKEYGGSPKPQNVTLDIAVVQHEGALFVAHPRYTAAHISRVQVSIPMILPYTTVELGIGGETTFTVRGGKAGATYTLPAHTPGHHLDLDLDKMTPKGPKV